MRYSAIVMAAVAAAFLPASVSAQDYGYSDVYYDLRLGGSSLSDANNTGPGVSSGINVESEFDTGFVGEIAVGSEFPSGFRAEFALGYSQYSVGDLTIIEDGGIGVFYGVGDLDGTTAAGDGDVGAFTYMVNGYYAFGNGVIQPYIGAGIGGAYLTADVSVLGAEIVDDSANVIAYQGIAGLEFRISSSVAIGARYTYFATTDPTFTDALGVDFDSEVQSHNAMMTIRFSG